MGKRNLIAPKKRNLFYWVKLLLVGLVFGIVFFDAGLAYLLTRPARSSLAGITPANAGLDFKDVTLVTHDGITLPGWYMPSQNKAAIILLHGYGANRLAMIPYAQFLVKHGYGVLLYDQRASGESGGNVRTYGWLDVSDVPAAIAYLQGQTDLDPERIGALGFSTGAEIALGAAAQTSQLKAVVAEGPGFISVQDMAPPQNLDEWTNIPFDWLLFKLMELATGASPPLPLSKAIQKIPPRPVLLISSGQDHEQRQVQHYYDLGREPKTHWNIPEAEHCGGLSARPDEYENRIIAFFNQALLK
jgi:fermentation-respiration switch protein FrsA (DUF1100 family)